jgi:hypothetical protein
MSGVLGWSGLASLHAQIVPKQKILSDQDIQRLEMELSEPATRLPAIADLADFGSMKLYNGGSVSFSDANPKIDALRERAAKLAGTYTDLDTVSQALDSDDPRLQMWGLMFWNGGVNKALLAAGRSPTVFPLDGLTAAEDAWHQLMPKIQLLAIRSSHREVAIDDLAIYAWSENREYLRSLIPNETSASVVLRLLQRTGDSNRDEHFNAELIRLLSDPDALVRQSTLAFIGWNWNSAEMWQVRFDLKIYEKVEVLRLSSDSEEKRLAEFAAEGLDRVAKLWNERDSKK